MFYKLNSALCAFFLKKAWHLGRQQEQKTNILDEGNLSVRMYPVSYQQTAVRDWCGSPSAVCGECNRLQQHTNTFGRNWFQWQIAGLWHELLL